MNGKRKKIYKYSEVPSLKSKDEYWILCVFVTIYA